MMIVDIVQLEKKISKLKVKLTQIVKETGLNSHETLRCSQKLDHYITLYQKYRKRNGSMLYPREYN
ncbi:aspartyl-phosphate phosphatase Spo0E family protein [Bacillus tuaregi]|uniref:aspartyl-phosphate phosphatase Spo0E family protein n=1 Tax=Bacillus tuaregi TaxID=1816695 RepID=UPI0008F8EE59|nr:aspartyl-phosphate phosphatase Spo0E family protein [Bacillus tuaregi]